MTLQRKILISILWVVAMGALLGTLWFRVLEPRAVESIADTLGQGDYRLVATDGTEFTAETLKGAPSAVFFGFTHCPEVCPTTLGDIATWNEELEKEGAPLRAFFITVDPERDTPDVLRDYVSWAPGVVGVSGSRAEIDKAIVSFRIYAARVPLDGGGYTMDHSANVLLFDKAGRLFEPIGYQEGFERALAKIRRMVAG